MNHGLVMRRVFDRTRDDPRAVALTKGLYLVTLRLEGAQLPQREWVERFPFTAAGKQMEMQRAEMVGDTLVMRIRVVENPIIIPILIYSAIASLGLVSFGFASEGAASALDSIDQLFDNVVFWIIGAGTLYGVAKWQKWI